jgi:hypothetical protein
LRASSHPRGEVSSGSERHSWERPEGTQTRCGSRFSHGCTAPAAPLSSCPLRLSQPASADRGAVAARR